MDHFAGLDVSVKETSLCIVDDFPTWPRWSPPCSLSAGCFVNRSSFCIAACWPSSGTMMCAGA